MTDETMIPETSHVACMNAMDNKILDLEIQLWREKRNRASNKVEYFELQRALPPELRYAHYPAHKERAANFLAGIKKEAK